MISDSLARKTAFNYIQQLQSFVDDRDKTACIDFLNSIDIEPPKAANDSGFFLRLVCSDWWARRLKRQSLKHDESARILKGLVKKGKQVYCSDQTVSLVKSRNLKTIQVMKNKMLVSDYGDELNMMDVLKASIANPANRRAEMMVRMAGFEQYADSQGHVGMFYTITCPSKYHRYGGGQLNPNYQHTPREGQKYLSGIWVKIRALFSYHGLTPYGFRVAEPHHDGTPHWHMLLFMPPEQKQQITEIINEVALREDGNEPGASIHRFTAKELLKEMVQADGSIKKVSATGYIAKYIAKNIGFDLESDELEDFTDYEDLTKSVTETSDRVRSWASVWGIRQFQQIGGSSVTVWRELRRLRDSDIDDETIVQARDYCVANDWAGYLEVMGGTQTKRKDKPLHPLKKNIVELTTGECKVNRYNELVEKIMGIKSILVEVVTHLKTWKIVNSSFHTSFANISAESRASGSAVAVLGVL